MRISLIVTFTAALVTGVAVAQTAPTKIGDSAKGKMLTSDSGMTLYVFFDRDADGKSACNSACTGLWPPLAATASATATGDYTIVPRDDGSKQWAYKKRPLYNWKNDQKPGDITGDASVAYGISPNHNLSRNSRPKALITSKMKRLTLSDSSELRVHRALKIGLPAIAC
jgi:predicted lipoprotein with Yx(FWY)xxD motif